MSADVWLGWIAIGAAASLAGMIWAFRRGVLGVLVNLATGIAGAVLAVLVSFLFIRPTPDEHVPARLFFAALGAIAALGLVHAAWAYSIAYRRSHPAAGP